MTDRVWIDYEDDDATVECASCDWTGPIYAVDAIRDIWNRVSAGETVPAGECPKCGSLAHIKKKTEPVIEMHDNVLTITLPED